MGKEHYTFEDFCEIIKILRDPVNGCPWDRVQTHDSLKKDFQSEVDEVFAGIDIYEKTGDAENLCEELGDVLMHVVLQARIAEQEGLFTMDDVIQGISRKMIRRHPHIFADGKEKTVDEVLMTWEEIKVQEKADKEKADKEKADKEKADKEKADKEKADKEKADKEKADREKE